MVNRDFSKTVIQMALLHEPNVNKAKLLDALNLNEMKDEIILNRLLDLIDDALAHEEPTVEIDLRLLQLSVMLIKNGIKKTRGGRQNDRRQEMRKSALISVARQLKAGLVASGESATQAHFQAAEDAAEDGERRGLHLSSGYLEREMYKKSRPH